RPAGPGRPHLGGAPDRPADAPRMALATEAARVRGVDRPPLRGYLLHQSARAGCADTPADRALPGVPGDREGLTDGRADNSDHLRAAGPRPGGARCLARSG